jgi:NADP-dependent 3-hydroxy acid dehydrogenase YdfG
MESAMTETTLAGRRALVTGASSGIGRATALALAAAGADVVATGRREDRLRALAQETSRGGITPIAGDITDKRFIASLAERAGPVGILVNNAGMSHNAPFLDGDMALWEQVIATNVTALLRLTQIVARGMAERGGGHIVNISSALARAVYPNTLVYAATKHAIRAISAGLRLDLHQKGIKVTEVAPGLIGDTDLLRHTSHPAFLEGLKERPYAPIAPEDVARTVVFAVGAPGRVVLDLIEVKPLGQP